MTLFRRVALVNTSRSRSGAETITHAPQAFSLALDAEDERMLRLTASPPGSRSAPILLWTRTFELADNRDAVLARIEDGTLDPVFLGRLTLAFGPDEIDRLVGGIVAEARARREAEGAEAAEQARKHLIVELFARDTKRGHTLELERASRTKPDWKVVYDRAVERDRLCDWLRWQKPRFLGFLDHAAEHGGEALTRLLTDEMFETERRVKKEGRGAGGSRPLRMWRGD